MSAAPPNLLIVEHPRPGLALLTLNRPEAMNALSRALRRALVATLDALERDGTVSVVILSGAGKAFCAGLDLAELSADAGVLAARDDEDPVAALSRFSGVVIGAINGVAVTGGLELALACDMLVASEEAQFADTHAHVGVMPGWGLSQRLSRTIGLTRAKRMSLTGAFISARQAEHWGLVVDVVSPDQLAVAALQLADDLLAVPADTLRTYKRLIDDGYSLSLREALVREARFSRDRNASLSNETLAARREHVQALGRRRKEQSR